MRRSSSTSHIPIAKGDTQARAKSAARSSIKDSTKKVRPNSTDRLAGPSFQRSTSSSNFNAKKSGAATPTLLGAKSYGAKKSSLSTAQNFGFKRSNSNLATPVLSSGARGRSPCRVASERDVNDKEWVAKQSRKVLIFLQRHPSCPDGVTEKLKPPITINTFVWVMNILLKELHPRLEEINNMNYKDIVFNMLKVFHYPRKVSNSLLKSVNTKHAWPSVVCIFAWLVDLITIVRRVYAPSNLEQDVRYQKVQCIINHIIQKHTLYNNDDDEHETADAQFKEEFAKILNIDEDELKQLEEEVTTLLQLKETQRNKIEQQQTKNDNLKKEIDTLQNEIDTFYLNKEDREEELNCKLNSLKTQREKLKQLIKAKRESTEALTDTIKHQHCSVEEKRRMESHIEELKHTIDLKKEKVKLQKPIKAKYEMQLAAARMEVETEVYRLNNSLMEIVLLDPELKILQLKETNFLSQDFENDVHNLIKNTKVFEDKLTNELAVAKATISKINSENSVLDSKMASMREKINFLNDSEKCLKNKIDTYKSHMEQMAEKREEEKKKFVEVIKKLKETELTLAHFQGKLKEVKNLKDTEAAALEIKKEQYLQFFVKLREMTIDYVGNMTAIRNQILDKLKQSLADTIQHQEIILKDLHELDDVTQ